MLFSELALHERVQKALYELGFEQATPVQEQTLPLAMTGKDLMVSAETGSGKTAAFLLPMLNHMHTTPSPKTSTRALVLVPTRELGLQVLKECEALARYTYIKAGLIVGGEDYRHQVNTLRKNPEILIATPGRLIEHIKNGNHDFNDLEYLVLDEADRMLDMGFGPDVLSIVEQCHGERQTFLFSATLEARGLGEMASRVLNDSTRLKLNSVREKHANIHQQIILSDDTAHKEKQLIWLLRNETYDKALVFTNTKARAEEFVGKIRVKGLKVGVLHGDMDQRARKHIMRLLQDGKINILIATDVAARGLDIKGVELVINLEMARNGDDYVHRIGRTGRAGEQGLAISLIGPDEWNRMSGIERYLRLRFEKRAIKDLLGSYKGPKKLKSSGKAAGKKKPAGKKGAGKKQSADKQRHRDKKNVGKRRTPAADAKPASATTTSTDSGFEPPRRRK
ncbi:DEAD/DEAH box helicase [Endozoicomonas sp. YOMI1]|uniref:DEAD/DEAH box helicase n=1 Tax=Endozoicomonas sp. YOMI1 TaxID=2828739 RepID=UPI002148A0C4|nr:DEAD/DEAH box helicase [Endozoicomonas sp. YOMI1]